MGGECGLFNMLGKQCQRSDSGKSQDYTEPLNPQLFKNIGHVGSFQKFVFVFVFVVVFVFCLSLPLSLSLA